MLYLADYGARASNKQNKSNDQTNTYINTYNHILSYHIIILYIQLSKNIYYYYLFIYLFSFQVLHVQRSDAFEFLKE